MNDPLRGRKVASWLWAFLPLYTLGIGTGPAMIWTAIHKRHLGQAVVAAFYSLLSIVYFAWPNSPEALVGTYVLLSWIAGTAHTLIIRRWAFDLPKTAPARTVGPTMAPPTPMPPPMPPHSPLQAQQQAVLSAAMDERHARDFARQLAANDPPQAFRLQIGRVDIPDRAFPDGGLIDVNNVPGQALGAATGLPAATVGRIATVREESNGFGSLDELCALTQLPPQTFDHLADRFYFPGKLPS